MTAPARTSISVPLISNTSLMQIMRVSWWLVAGLGILAFIVVIPANWEYFQSNPSAWNGDPLYGPPFVEGLNELGIPAQLYAAFRLFVSASVFGAFYAIGYIIFRSRFQERIGMQAAFCFVALGAFVSLVSGETEYYDTESLNNLINVAGWVLAIIGWGTLYLFLPLYPDGRFVPRWAILAPLTWVFTMIVTAINPDSDWSGDSESPIVSLIIFIGLIGIPLTAQVYRYLRVSTQLQRQQTKWFVFVIALLFVEILLSVFVIESLDRFNPTQAILADLADTIVTVSFILLPMAVGFAILRYRLWDIDLVINKSLVYGLIIASALILFVAVLTGLQITIGETQPLIALIISGVVSAALFKPAQKTVQNLIDRYVYRLRFDLNELAAAHKKQEVTHPGPLTGKILNGYELGNLIGRGGMGEIYRGVGQDNVVAVKTLLPELSQDKDLLTRFQREIEVGMSLKHRHIAEVYDSGKVDGIPYLIMEYIEGQDLNSILKRDGALDEETTWQIMQNVCSALDAIHAAGMIHRDLKPANIMLRENGEAVVMDFGIIKVTDATSAVTGTGAIGTIDYMAPEQIMSAKAVDLRADIYALGIIAYQLLTGEKPFKGSPAQVMFAHIQQPAPFVSDVNPDIPSNIAQAINQALAKNPDDRFSSASEFVASLAV